MSKWFPMLNVNIPMSIVRWSVLVGTYGFLFNINWCAILTERNIRVWSNIASLMSISQMSMSDYQCPNVAFLAWWLVLMICRLVYTDMQYWLNETSVYDLILCYSYMFESKILITNYKPTILLIINAITYRNFYVSYMLKS